jgi:hypothetical protein
MKPWKLLGMAALVIALSVGLTGPAQAAGSKFGHTDDWWPYMGEMTFTPHSDKLQVCDNKKDGMGVIVYVNDVTQHRHKYNLEIGGSGKCKTRKASWGNPYNLREGHKFSFEICRIWHVEDGPLENPSHYNCNTYTWKNNA